MGFFVVWVLVVYVIWNFIGVEGGVFEWLGGFL